MRFLILLFIILPIIELWLLIQVGSVIGATPTIGLVLLTGIIGGWLARSQGLRVLQEFMTATQQGQFPAKPILDGAAILIGGAFLLTPGIVTDVAGFALLIPQTRKWLMTFATRYVIGPLSGTVVWHVQSQNRARRPPYAQPQDPTIIDASFDDQ